MSNSKPRRMRKLVPILIVLGGILIMALMFSTRQKPERTKHVSHGALVDIMLAQIQTISSEISAHGTVRPFRQIQLSPQIAGKIDWVSPRLLAGGRFEQGEVLARIEAIDYELAVDQAAAAVAQTEYQLSVAEAQADIAAREWKRLGQESGVGSEGGSKPDALVLHEPQLKQARANLASSQARLKMAQLNLERTALHAPFDCRVRSESIDPGQYVNPGMPVATLYSTELVEVDIGLPVADMTWLEIPGSKATVILNLGDDTVQWEGVVDRSVGVIDTAGRLARVIVQVANPFDLSNGSRAELSIGSFVDVRIEGRELANTIPIPRAALHSGNKVWVANPDSTLEIRGVEVARSSDEEVFVTSGLRDGEQVILTSLSGAANGMKLRPVKRETER